jgi:hypothetical protein
MIENLVELIAVAGLERLDQLKPEDINHRVSGTDVRNYRELYPCITQDCLLDGATCPDSWKERWSHASAEAW